MGRKSLISRDFVSMESIAGYCMVSPSTVRRWMKDGKLHAIQLPSGHYRVSVANFRDFLKQNNIPISKDLIQN
jgi:excisionase family DNA binding protein